ncbi:MAG TPA: Rv2578c family radical SAM protein [Propionibacteriaceae bacterium]|nr:Rv2578c family radical SAM protein [Propionibacteriaceae bacterium]
MRWQGQTLTSEDPAALPGLESLAGVPGLLRTVRTPEFADVTFHEVRCRSALNRVPDASRVPFRWTINPYRGCTHGCVYCFARNTHTYLDLDPGRDFDTQIVVKINIADVLRRELARPSWTREHVAMGTNTDPYQRAEGRYRLMPEVINALAQSGTPFSILTKGTLLSRDLPLLAEAGRRVKVGVSISLALLDPELHATLEPGTPTPQARLNLIRRIRAAGLSCGVLVAPILPYLTDSDGQLERLVGEISAAGATSISGIALHLRPGAREWFLGWLGREHPDLVPAYERLYKRGAYVPKAYSEDLQGRLRTIMPGVPRVRR